MEAQTPRNDGWVIYRRASQAFFAWGIPWVQDVRGAELYPSEADAGRVADDLVEACAMMGRARPELELAKIDELGVRRLTVAHRPGGHG